MTSGQVAGLLATVGAAFLAQSIACALLFRRVRHLAGRAPDPPGGAGVDPAEVAARLGAIEARLGRVEAGAAAPAPVVAPEAKRLRRLDRRQVASADGPVLIAVPSLALPPAGPPTAAAAEELGRRFGGIWALADAGLPVDAIAREAGVPAGQVELILGLRHPKAGGEGPRAAPDRDAADA